MEHNNAIRAAVHSVHSLVRLLKSSTDPPSAPGPSKIEIASFAWSDSSFRAANKGEVIAEWVLTQLGEAKKTRGEKDAKSTSDPITDLRYWTLLCDVLTTPSPTAARPMKTWLLPLLNRFQLDAIVLELLTLQSSRVLGPVRTALAVLWPLAQKKIGVDALGECLNAVFETCADWERVDDDLAWICSAVVDAYRNALGNAGNKKKLYTSFLTTHLSPWLYAICNTPSFASSSPTKLLQNSIYAAGTDTLFSLDALKQSLDTLFDAFSSTFIPSLLPVLPKLFLSFLSAIHRHRSALFVSATSVIGGREETRKKAMEFVRRCWTRVWGGTSLQEGVDVEKWKSIIGVFEIVEKERLFVANSRGTQTDATNGEHGGDLALREARDKAVEMLEIVDAFSEHDRAQQVVLPAQLLDVLVQIEYDFIGSVLERVLSALINIPLSLLRFATTPFSDFLTHILEYHTKTRTVHTYVLALLGAMVAKPTSPISSSLSVTGAFPLAYHLPAVARALRTSLTPTQVTPLVTEVIQAVKSAWMAVKDALQAGERLAKKRKVGGSADKSEREAISDSIRAFSYTCRTAGTVLSNLPANAYTEDGEYSLEPSCGDVGNLGWTIIWETLRERIGKGGEHDKVKGGDTKKRKHAAQDSPLSASYPHVVTSASLRFLYDIRARVSHPLGDCDRLGEAHVQTLLNAARDEASEPELVLEIIRTLLWHIWFTHNRESQKQLETERIFTVTLDILTAHLSSESKWSGVSAALTRDNLGIALLYVLTDRWIDVLDALASPESLERLISLLLTISLDPPEEDIQEDSAETYLQRAQASVTSRGILLSLLRNAQFWELHNIRAVFLSSLLTLTAPLSSYSFPAAAVESPLTVGAAGQAQLTLACSAYRLLDHVPSEYFTRPVRAELVRRAIAGDVQICTTLKGANRKKGKTKGRNLDRSHTEPAQKSHGELDDGVSEEELKGWSSRLTFIRVFLQRMGRFLNTPGHATSFAFGNHLLSPPSCITSPPKALASVTLDLIQSHALSLLRSQEPEAVASISSIITTFIVAQPFSQPRSQETWTHVLVQSSVLNLVERLTSDFIFASLLGEVQRALKTLFEALESALLPETAWLVERDPTELNQLLSSERINAWSRFLSLKRWLGIDSQAAFIPFGLKLATSIVRSENSGRLDAEVCSSVLGLLFEELSCMPDVSHHIHLDVLAALYAAYCGDWGLDGVQQVMDNRIIQVSKKLSVGDFAHLLGVLAEGIGGGKLQMGQRERLIHLGKVMLHNAPPGTLNVIQGFVTGWLNLFADREQIYGGSSNMKMECLEFIARHCSDRPTSIRSVDLGSIWTFLHKILSGSSEHDTTTAFPIFHHIVTIIGALVRLRRDLVVHTFPHLGLVLRQLMMLTRKIRPQLGAKQSKLVTDTLPSWLSTSEPLSTDEARALARLLTSLTTKTVPRTHTTTAGEPQKAESLAKPFAKHASYVLVAYVDAFNDPLCIINAEMRRELEPGLFALCEMVGEHSRDALMVSALDSGGKTILKSLWRDYEKQRYVGKG